MILQKRINDHVTSKSKPGRKKSAYARAKSHSESAKGRLCPFCQKAFFQQTRFEHMCRECDRETELFRHID